MAYVEEIARKGYLYDTMHLYEVHTESNLPGLASKSFTFEKVLYSKKAQRNQVRLFDTILK